MKKLMLLIPFVFVFLYFSNVIYTYCFLRIRLSDDYYIQQKPFTKNYLLKSKEKGIILEYIYEWKEVDNYIYGSCYKDNDYYYLYEKKNNNLLLFEDLHSFYIKLDMYNLTYTMDNCTRVMDCIGIY